MTSIIWYSRENFEDHADSKNERFFSFFHTYLQEVKNYYETIIAAMPGNVYWLNRDAILLGGNENLANVFGLQSYKNLAGLTYEEMARLANWTEGQGESFKADELRVMKSGVPQVNVEEPPVFIDGHKRYYISNKVPLKNISGEIIGVLGISLDITDRKKNGTRVVGSQRKSRSGQSRED
ncbi:MAG: PAS domain-containing protein [Gammaproteobacteria bacterium]|nr:PAS domain-containing protein [Gammaproteobacteria bacterium]